MRKTIKLKFIDFFSGFDKEQNEFLDVLQEYYPVVQCDDPDYVIYSGFGYEHLKYDCIRIFFTGECQTPDFNECDYAIGFDRLRFGDRYARIPLYNVFQYKDAYQTLKSRNSFSTEDIKGRGFCSFVVSNCFTKDKRDVFFEMLSKYKHVASGGRYKNNIGGAVKDKYKFLGQYKFNIAFENCSHDGYVTEKIMEAFAAGVVPIYYGDPRIAEDFNPKAFINANDFSSFEAMIEKVKEIVKVKEIRRRAIAAGLKLVDCPIRHLGTEKAHEVYSRIEKFLIDNGVNILFDTSAGDLIINDGVCEGAHFINNVTKQEFVIKAERVIVAVGRVGADWLDDLCRKYGIKRRAGVVDIGVRVECRNEVMEEVNDVLYESKLIGYVPPYNDKVRTFCQNPGGFVSQENYEGGLAVVNGHSFKDKKSKNTNVAILSSHHFRVPFDQPIEYARKVGELTNMLGNGQILVQRFGDILDGKRTWEKELARSNVRPTLPDAVAGDITAAMPYRPMSNIINFIKAVDKVVPGFAGKETLLYSPEIKFYSNKVEIDERFETSVRNLYTLGDGSGWTRGLMQASLMGVLTARNLFSE